MARGWGVGAMKRLPIALLILPLLTLPAGGAYSEPLRTPLHQAWDPCPGLRLNEFLPTPLTVDWNHDGNVNSGDEWIELYNDAGAPCNLQGWALDDIEALAPSPPFTVTVPFYLGSYSYAVLYRSQTGVHLHNDADVVRLLRPDGTEAERYQYWTTFPDQSCSRISRTLWECWLYRPTPGWANGRARPVHLPLVALSK